MRPAEGQPDHTRRAVRAADVCPNDFNAISLLPQLYLRMGRPTDSHAAVVETLARARRELAQQPENTHAAAVGGLMLATLGEPEQAREWLTRALMIEPEDFITLYDVACDFAALGERDRAIELLQRASPGAHPEFRAWLEHDADLDPLRADARFGDLLREWTGT